ncbi:MAG: cytochrome ubiquinol oxidase subunit I [Micrococcaceae bacterium]
MDPMYIARWQFGITTVYHFLMVPLTIGLGLVVAVLQTQWYRTGKEEYLRMTKFWGKLFLINFIMGVATGIVQEFQFGLAWSEYSRFVGDVFGAPLAMEALLAFFLESTFLGVWIFGWNKLSKGAHLTALWLAVAGSTFSAYFIIAANSFMQHPVGVHLNNGRAEMVSIWAVLSNNTAVNAFAHVILGAIAVAGSFLFGISWYKLYQRRKDGIDTVDEQGNVVVGSDESFNRDKTDYLVWIKSLRRGAWVAIIAFGLLGITGDLQAKLMFKQQPMKMASAEALCHTEDSASFSVFAIGNVEHGRDCAAVKSVDIPYLLSFLAEGNTHAQVKGVDELITEYQSKYGNVYPDDKDKLGKYAGQKIDYQPILPVTYWGFRLMIGAAALSTLACALGLWLTRKGTVPESKLLNNLAVLSILGPFGANSAGWIFTEMGRQPFVVAPNPDGGNSAGVHMFTAQAVSPSLTGGEVLFSLISLTTIYAVLAFFEVKLLVKYVNQGVVGAMPELEEEESDTDGKSDKDVLAFAY